jgi:hypothetical protein
MRKKGLILLFIILSLLTCGFILEDSSEEHSRASIDVSYELISYDSLPEYFRPDLTVMTPELEAQGFTAFYTDKNVSYIIIIPPKGKEVEILSAKWRENTLDRKLDMVYLDCRLLQCSSEDNVSRAKIIKINEMIRGVKGPNYIDNTKIQK